MTSQKKNKKYFALLLLTIFVSVELFGIAAPIATASTQSKLDEAMDYFGVPKDQRTFGVADRKAEAPQVRVEFSPTNPKPGEEVTATAYTSGFRDMPQDQYYTWYLRDGEASKTKVRSPDASASYKKMEQYKIDAHKLIAKKQTLDRFSAESGPDDDGYRAHLGGHSQQRTINDYCYIYDFENTGILYEIVDNKNNHQARFWTNEWVDTYGNTQSGHECEGTIEIEVNGETVLAEIEPACVVEQTVQCSGDQEILPISGDIDADGSDGGDAPSDGSGDGGAGGTGATATGEIVGGGGGGDTIIPVDVCTVVSSPECIDELGAPDIVRCDQGMPTCVIKNIEQYHTDHYGTCPANADGRVTNRGIWKCHTDTHTPGKDGRSQPTLVIDDRATLWCGAQSGDQIELNGGFERQCNSIEKGPEDTIHLFPQPQVVGDGNFTTGDGEFLSKEEQYWGTDPNNPMSAGNGKLDEENIVGRGVDKFTWIYEKGDQVGVVVEGSAHIPTGHDDASFATMWAFLHNRCDLLGEQQTGKYTETIGGDKNRNTSGNSQRFDTIDADRETLTKCLYDNFTPVGQGGKPGAMDISLSFTPDAPSPGVSTRDANGNDINVRPTDEITVTAQIANSDKDLSQVHFTWCMLGAEYIYSGRAMPAGGEEPPEKEFFPAGRRFDQLLNCAFYPPETAVEASTPLQGIGQSTISFTTTTDQPYLLVRVEAGEHFSTETTEIQGGYAIIYIPLKDNGDTYLRSSQVSISGDKLNVVAETCADSEANNTICRVGKNEIIGLDLFTSDPEINTSEISDLKFRIEGAGSTCTDQCANDPNDEYFFAATGAVGETITAKASYTNIESQQEFNLSRTFVITEPYVEIVPEDDAMRSYLGEYVYRGEEFEDLSDVVFQASPGDAISLTANVHPSWGTNDEYFWDINGLEQSGKTVPLLMGSDTINIHVETIYEQSRAVRKALKQHFGVSQFLSTEYHVQNTVQIIPTINPFASGEQQEFLATISTNAPNFILFVIRTLLMMSLIIFIAGFIFRITPQQENH